MSFLSFVLFTQKLNEYEYTHLQMHIHCNIISYRFPAVFLTPVCWLKTSFIRNFFLTCSFMILSIADSHKQLHPRVLVTNGSEKDKSLTKRCTFSFLKTMGCFFAGLCHLQVCMFLTCLRRCCSIDEFQVSL